MTRKCAGGIAAALLFLLAADTASADITGFLGLSGGPGVRSNWGLAAGISFVVVGVEFEYADVAASVADAAPRIRTGSGNLLLQTPIAVGGIQFYGTAGAGGYRMTWEVPLAGQSSETNAAVNLGGGIKLGLLGPLRLRADYRYFRFMGAPVQQENIHRFYIGANLKF